MALGGLSLLLVLGLLLLAAVLWHTGQAWRQRSGLPEGEVIYTDTGAWETNDQVLHAPDVRLVGKPDYLVRQHGGAIIPVEVKSGAAPAQPWEGQVLQLAAYCLLVESTYGVRPPYGILQYRDRAFAIDYTDDLEADLLDVLREMRGTLALSDVEPDHNDWRRCAGCGVRAACEKRLA
jgi:CRISPR-associated exonuclease Cas4